jgi:subtilisin family serine protease
VRRGVQKWVTAALLAAVAPVAAPTAGAGTKTFTVRSGNTPSDEAVNTLARIAVPRHVNVQPGENIENLVHLLCGSTPPVYLSLLKAANPTVSWPIVSEPGVLTVPACFYVKKDVRVTTTSGDSLSSLATTHIGVTGTHILDAIVKLNAKTISCKGSAPFRIPSDFSRCGPLQPSKEISIPYQSLAISYQLTPEAQLDPSGSLSSLDSQIRGNSVAPPGAGVGATASSDDVFILPVELQASPQSTAMRCPSSDPANLFDAALLLKVLATNKAERARISQDVVPTVVEVADSGIGGFDTASFPRSMFDVLPIVQGHYTDGSPLFGEDLYVPSRPPLAYSSYTAAAHGTHVSGLVRGGPAFLEAAGRQGFDLPLKLLIVHMVERTVSAGAIPVEKFSTPAGGISEATVWGSEHSATIVNVSFAADRLLGTLWPILKNNDRLLLVASAGNDHKNLDQQPASFPGSYGGVSGLAAAQVISVGAHDNRLALAPFSNFGSQSVDLAAPGCNVVSYGLDGSPLSYSGTSQATPLVSFVAALLASEGIASARQLKARIVSSVDVYSALEGAVASSGVLDAVKALSLYRDVLQLSAPSSELKFGRVVSADGSIPICDGTSVALSSVYKVNPNFHPSDAKPMRVIYAGPLGGLRNPEYCAQSASGIDFLADGASSATHYDWHDVSDLVPALSRR